MGTEVFSMYNLHYGGMISCDKDRIPTLVNAWGNYGGVEK